MFVNPKMHVKIKINNDSMTNPIVTRFFQLKEESESEIEDEKGICIQNTDFNSNSANNDPTEHSKEISSF